MSCYRPISGNTFHVKHFLAIFLLFPLFSWSQSQFVLQDKPFTPIIDTNRAILEFVEDQIRGKGYTLQEKMFFYYIQSVRSDPKKFHKEIVEPFLKEFPEAVGTESRSLKEDLLAARDLSRLYFNPQLRDIALEHATDLAQEGIISHIDSKGRTFQQRIRIGGFTKCAAENIYTGKNDGLLAVLMLLLDIGLPSAGHRKNILNPSFTQMSLSIRPSLKSQSVYLVQIFGCR